MVMCLACGVLTQVMGPVFAFEIMWSVWDDGGLGGITMMQLLAPLLAFLVRRWCWCCVVLAVNGSPGAARLEQLRLCPVCSIGRGGYHWQPASLVAPCASLPRTQAADGIAGGNTADCLWTTRIVRVMTT